MHTTFAALLCAFEHREPTETSRNSSNSCITNNGAARAAHLLEMTMTDDETTRLMAHYGITATQQSVFHYRGFRYLNLTDALNYAEVAAARASVLPSSKPSRGE